MQQLNVPYKRTAQYTIYPDIIYLRTPTYLHKQKFFFGIAYLIDHGLHVTDMYDYVGMVNE